MQHFNQFRSPEILYEPMHVSGDEYMHASLTSKIKKWKQNMHDGLKSNNILMLCCGTVTKSLQDSAHTHTI